MLLNRRSERRLLDELVADVRAGESRALVIRGEAGIGKTALLEYVVGRAGDFRTERAAGVEAEKELAFAALHQVCMPMLDRLGKLPDPQQDALSTAFGMSSGSPPDPFMVGLAVLGLLAEVAHGRPLLCVFDDAQWLDRASAQVLAFAARRLLAESVAMIFAVRAPQARLEVPELAGLAQLPVTGLPDDEARALLTSAHPGPADVRVLERIVAEAQGNPLALLELPRGFTPLELAGGFGLSRAPLPHRIEESFRRQLAALPAPARQVLLVAAAEPVGDPVVVFRAVDRLGIGAGVEAAMSRAASGLVEFASRVRFRHPLLRSAVYDAASPAERQRVHRALAEVTDPVADPDRRAWHLAQAAAGPEEDVAAELEHRAGRAQTRGGPAAAAAFFERASELTPDPLRRGQRALAAAQAKYEAGLPDASLRLLALADASPLGEFQRAQADLLRARVAFTMGRGRDALPLLLGAARRLEGLDPRLARDTYLETLRAGWFAGHLASPSLREIAEVVRAAPAPVPPLHPSDLLLEGLAARYADGYAAGAPALQRAVRAFRDADLPAEEAVRWLWFATTMAMDLMDDETADVLTSRFVRLARESGALTVVPMALTVRIVFHVLAGEMAATAAGIEELDAVVAGTAIGELPYANQLAAAWRGQEDRTAELTVATIAESERRGEGTGLVAAGWMRALLYNGLGRYEEALAAAQQAVEPRQETGIATWAALVELVTAASRSGRPELASGALSRLSEFTRASGSDWGLGLEACCRGLAGDGVTAEDSYREAIERLARAGIRGQLARAHLHYGEWLRRRNRRVDARDQLRTAHEMFAGMGMDGFAELAAGELRATGETVRRRQVDTAGELTAQEAQVVRLVRDGLSNQEIAARLFLSRRTVEWHLGKIFAKLHISSRRQLRR